MISILWPILLLKQLIHWGGEKRKELFRNECFYSLEKKKRDTGPGGALMISNQRRLYGKSLPAEENTSPSPKRGNKTRRRMKYI